MIVALSAPSNDAAFFRLIGIIFGYGVCILGGMTSTTTSVKDIHCSADACPISMW